MFAQIKLYFFAALAFGVSVFVWIFRARGRKIKKQNREIKGHESTARVTEGDKKRTVKSRANTKKNKESTSDEASKKANARNRG